MPTLPIPLPLQGVSRRVAYQNQPPNTSHTLTNVWTVSADEGRAVVATRPPYAPYDSPGIQVNLMTQVNLPSPTAFAGSDGTLFRRDDTIWTDVGSGIPAAIPTMAIPFLQDILIPASTSMVYQHSTGAVTPMAPETIGDFPEGCRVGMVYENSVWLFNTPDTPHALFACRTGQLYDWDFSADDELSAIVGTVDAFGLIIEPIVAAIPLRGHAILAGENSMYLMTGHPLRGGRVDLLSDNTGILGQFAWVKVPGAADEVYFLSKRGLHRIIQEQIRPEITATPISRDLVPEELIGLPVDIENPNVVLAYDTRWNGIVISIRGENEQAWRYDPALGGFTRMVLEEYPLCAFSYDDLLTEDASGLLFGCESGIRRFDRSEEEAEEIDSESLYGPVKISESSMQWSTIRKAHIVLGSSTADDEAIVSLYTGDDGETANNRALSDFPGRRYSTTVEYLRRSGGLCYPQLSGAAVVMTVRQSGSIVPVVVEEVMLDIYPSGDNTDVGMQSSLLDVPEDFVEMLLV